MQKMIKIPSEKRMKIRGDMYGPINTPHMEKIEAIGLMLFYNVPVIEVLHNGTEIELTLENYKNNNNSIPSIPLEPSKPIVPMTPLEPAKPVEPLTPLEPSTPVEPEVTDPEPPGEGENNENVEQTRTVKQRKHK